MASLGLCWREVREAQAQSLCAAIKGREASCKPTPGGGWGFRRQNPRDRLTTTRG